MTAYKVTMYTATGTATVNAVSVGPSVAVPARKYAATCKPAPVTATEPNNRK